MNIRIIIAGAALLAQFAFAGAANAGFELNYYEGSRDDVRQHCAGDGRILIDRLDYTFCEDKLAGVSRNCDAEGDCLSTGVDSMLMTGEVARPSVDDEVRIIPASAPGK